MTHWKPSRTQHKTHNPKQNKEKKKKYQKKKAMGSSRVRINDLNHILEVPVLSVAKRCLLCVGNRERGQEPHTRSGMTEKVLPVLCTNPWEQPAGKGDTGLCSRLGNYTCSNTPEHSVWQPTAGEMKLLLSLFLLHLFIFLLEGTPHFMGLLYMVQLLNIGSMFAFLLLFLL